MNANGLLPSAPSLRYVHVLIYIRLHIHFYFMQQIK